MKTRPLFVLIICLFMSGWSMAQVDSLKQEMQQLVEAEQYEQALQLGPLLLESSTDKKAAKLYLIRIKAWKGDWAKAELEALVLQAFHPEDAAITFFLTDLMYWQERYEEANEWLALSAKSGLPTNSFYTKKASIQLAQENWAAAQKSLDSISTPSPAAARLLQQRIRQVRASKLKNALTVTHIYDSFTYDKSFWNRTSVSYKRETKVGPVLGIVNRSKRFDIEGFQVGLSAYPRWSKKAYSFASIAYSDSPIYPDINGAISIFNQWSRHYETEFGFTYMEFDGATKVWFHKASLSKYAGNTLINGGVMIIRTSEGLAYVQHLKFRQYLRNGKGYFSAEFGVGNTARDFQASNAYNEVFQLSSKRATIGINRNLSPTLSIKASGGLEQALYQENITGMRLTLEGGLSYRF